MTEPDRVPSTHEHRRRLAQPRRRIVLELHGLAAVLALYSWLHNLAGTDVARATTNAHTLQRLEHALGLNIELAANHWLAASPLLSEAATWYYRLYYLPLAGVLLWVLFCRPAVYRKVRVTLIVMAATALVVFWLLPVSPPRFALPGIVDIVAEHDIIAGTASRNLANGANHFSAFPSMHVGWSALCAYAAWLALRGAGRRWATLVWLFPLVMIAVVITTGNYYALDIAGSAALLTVSITTAIAWERYQPRPTPQRHPTTARPTAPIEGAMDSNTVE